VQRAVGIFDFSLVFYIGFSWLPAHFYVDVNRPCIVQRQLQSFMGFANACNSCSVFMEAGKVHAILFAGNDYHPGFFTGRLDIFTPAIQPGFPATCFIDPASVLVTDP
jgi:hypothetical protein